jgi:type IV fimbrial biogenesis protein FimT
MDRRPDHAGGASADRENVMLRNAGFTLLELLIAISIVALLSAIALPGFDILNNKRISQSQVENLQRALTMARQSAMTSNRPTIVCPSSDGGACEDRSAWTRGFMIFEDRNFDGVYSAATDRLLEYIPGVRNVATRHDTRHYRHALSSNRDRAAFTAQGFTSSMQTFTYCDGNSRKAYELTLNMAGRVQLRHGDGSSC